MSTISLGDTVRIFATIEMEQLGSVGCTGMVYGWSTPSDTGTQVIGSIANDRAIAVKLEGQDDPLWFDPDLVELVDHTPGTMLSIGNKRFTRDAGEWIEDAHIEIVKPDTEVVVV